MTESMKYAAKLSKENGFHISITHVAIRALALAISKTKDIQGALKWGNVRHLKIVRSGRQSAVDYCCRCGEWKRSSSK